MRYKPPKEHVPGKRPVSRLRRARQAVSYGLLAVAVTVIGSSAWAAQAARPRPGPVIRSVTFSGNARNSTITIRGKAFRDGAWA
jgi:hypothetical protein